MICKNCGLENSEEEEFCTKCGLHLKYVSYKYEKIEPKFIPFYHTKNFYIKLLILGAVSMFILIYITMIEPM